MDECPLCLSKETRLFHTTDDKTGRREFMHCGSCDLMFVPRAYHLSPRAEKARYLTHNNDPNDKEYRRFLGRLFEPLRPRLKQGATGLDYGAGPGPALAAMMREAGFDARIYDPYFHPDRSVLDRSYDFITCTETAEHFSKPRDEFDSLQSLLSPSGWLGVMTEMLDTWEDFAGWHYHNDPTHVCFYSKRTMSWIGKSYSWDVVSPRRNVVLFHKPRAHP